MLPVYCNSVVSKCDATAITDVIFNSNVPAKQQRGSGAPRVSGEIRRWARRAVQRG